MIVCLGTGIENDDAAHPTETILFQGHLKHESQSVWVNGLERSTFPHTEKFSTGGWLLDVHGTGYWVPENQVINVSTT